MEITIRPTGKFEGVSGAKCRIWRGVTDKGVECEMFVAMVAVKADAADGSFEAELNAIKAERELVYFDHRMVI